MFGSFPNWLVKSSNRWTYRYYTTTAGTIPLLQVLYHYCRYYTTTAGTIPLLQVLYHYCRYNTTTVGTIPLLQVLYHYCRYYTTTAGTIPLLQVLYYAAQHAPPPYFFKLTLVPLEEISKYSTAKPSYVHKCIHIWIIKLSTQCTVVQAVCATTLLWWREWWN